PTRRSSDLCKAQAFEDLVVGLFHVAQISSETVFVQLLVGVHIPQTAGIRGNLVCQDDGSVRQFSELDLEVDQLHAGVQEILLQKLVDFTGICFDGINLFLGSQSQSQRVVIVDEGIAQRVVLVAELQNRAEQLFSFLHAHALGKASRSYVADNHFQGNDIHFLYGRLPVRQLLHKMGGNSGLLKLLEHIVGHAVVHHTLAGDGSFFLSVERGGVIFVIHDYHAVHIRREYFLCFSFIQLFQFFHESDTFLPL